MLIGDLSDGEHLQDSGAARQAAAGGKLPAEFDPDVSWTSGKV